MIVINSLNDQFWDKLSVNLILFGYMDENDNGVYDVGVDIKPYSQNIPFQGLYASST